MAYTPEWWKTAKDRINRRRAERYAKDPEYREAAKRRAKEYRERKKKEKAEAKKAPTITLNGHEVPAVTTHQVCENLGITAQRIKYMQRAGYLPPALVTRPVRLYTKKQEGLIKLLEEFLRTHEGVLKGPVTPESEKLSGKLDSLVTTIDEEWET